MGTYKVKGWNEGWYYAEPEPLTDDSKLYNNMLNSLKDKYPQLLIKRMAPCHCPDGFFSVPTIVSAIVMHLNDSHGWSREAVAGWVDSL